MCWCLTLAVPLGRALPASIGWEHRLAEPKGFLSRLGFVSRLWIGWVLMDKCVSWPNGKGARWTAQTQPNQAFWI